MKYLQYFFPTADTQAVCLTQSTTGGGSLVINGSSVNPVTNQCSFIDKNYTHQISVTSTNNLSGATFTITGIQNQLPFTEQITGPNIGTVYSNNFFDLITSVSVDTAVANVSIGRGNVGAIIVYPLGNPFALAIKSDSSTNPIGIAIYGALEDIPLPGFTLINDILNGPEALYPLQQFVVQPYTLLQSKDIYKSLIIGFVSSLDNSAYITFIVDN